MTIPSARAASGISRNLIAIAAGGWHNLGLGADGTVSAWGEDSNGQCDVPATLVDALAIAAGGYHSLALRADGSVVAWGADDDGQTSVPVGLAGVIGIAAGTWHSVALRADGRVVVWGDNSFRQTNQPTGLTNMTAVAAGGNHTLALSRNDAVGLVGSKPRNRLCLWSSATPGYADLAHLLVTKSNCIAVGFWLRNTVQSSNLYSTGSASFRLRANGTVVAWGENRDAEGNVAGQSMVPWDLTNVVAIGAGKYHSLAVKGDGTVVAWGDNSQDQCNVPSGLTNVVAVAGGGGHSVALGADGKVTAWGASGNGQCNLPPALVPAAGIAAGENHTLVLLVDSLPVPCLLHPARKGNRFSALVQTLSPKDYALECKDSLAATNWTAVSTNPGNGALRLLTDPAATASQRFYRMRQW